jgi:hypothetical protein
VHRNRIEPTIASSRQSLDISGVVRIIAERLPELGDRDSETIVEVLNRGSRPYPFANLLPGDYFAGVLQKHQENAERLVL